jgi:hypothetical protein
MLVLRTTANIYLCAGAHYYTHIIPITILKLEVYLTLEVEPSFIRCRFYESNSILLFI